MIITLRELLREELCVLQGLGVLSRDARHVVSPDWFLVCRRLLLPTVPRSNSSFSFSSFTTSIMFSSSSSLQIPCPYWYFSCCHLVKWSSYIALFSTTCCYQALAWPPGAAVFSDLPMDTRPYGQGEGGSNLLYSSALPLWATAGQQDNKKCAFLQNKSSSKVSLALQVKQSKEVKRNGFDH